MAPRYRSRMPSAILRVFIRDRLECEDYVPNNLRSLLKHIDALPKRPRVGVITKMADAAIIRAIEENRTSDAIAMSKHFCMANFGGEAMVVGNVDILRWLESIDKEIYATGSALAYMHTDVLGWLKEHGALDQHAVGQIAAITAQGHTWALQNNFTDEVTGDISLWFALKTGVYDEEHLLQRYHGFTVALLSDVSNIFRINSRNRDRIFPYWREVMPRIVKHINCKNKEELVAKFGELAFVRGFWYDVENLAEIFGDLPDPLR